ncbi:hypothetical protein AcW1_001633 [Taiwanofungus camphoratus]|nr:hypothetical protein AcW1_001633 [Antrodia cinnamomea]
MVIPKGMSPSTGGAKPNLCLQMCDHYPYPIILVAEAKTEKLDHDKAMVQMAFEAHHTLFCLLVHHYHSHGWAYNKLDKVMADTPLHELDFLFSVFYSHDEVSIFVNFPSMYFDNRIGELRWQFRCELVQKYDLTSKPTLRNLVTLFEAIFRDPASTVLQEFATFKKNSENNSDSRPKPIQEEKPQDNADAAG